MPQGIKGIRKKGKSIVGLVVELYRGLLLELLKN
jgi:hypothetical protein